MHHTHLVLDETFVPKTDKEKAVFQEMQIFMYVVMEEHLKTDKGKLLVSKYEADNDAQSIYHELKKHGTSSTAAWLSGDTLMMYIIYAKYPGEWRCIIWICIALARTAGKI
jgi:Cft2 family RNA processing exonuclease